MKLSVAVLVVVGLIVAIDARKNCQKQMKKAKKAGNRIPQCDGNSKNFLPRQCGEDKCFCAKVKSGKQRYGDFEIPASEEFDCSRKPTSCEKERFAALIRGTRAAVPKCDKNGDPIRCTSVQENVALNQPAFQSSMGWNGLPERGVDGNAESQWGGASCTHTMNKQGEWWAVDLGAQQNVVRVEITNRKDCCSSRLADFTIGVTNTPPTEVAPAPGNYDVCAVNSKALGAGETKEIACAARGRYLVVQQNGAQYLTLCEVKVIADLEKCD